MKEASTTTTTRKWPFYTLAAIFAGVGYAMGWLGKDSLVWPSFAAALACVVVANLDRIRSIKAGGVEAVLNEAKAAVRESRDLALVTAKMLLSLVQRAGRIGGYSTTHQNEVRAAVDRVLRQFEATEDERRGAYSDWNALVRVDYVFGILGSRVPNFTNDQPNGTEAWKALRARTSNIDPPSPDELRAFLEQYGFLDEERAQLVEDYRHYVQHADHRRPAVWEQRDIWGRTQLGTPG